MFEVKTTDQRWPDWESTQPTASSNWLAARVEPFSERAFWPPGGRPGSRQEPSEVLQIAALVDVAELRDVACFSHSTILTLSPAMMVPSDGTGVRETRSPWGTLL